MTDLFLVALDDRLRRMLDDALKLYGRELQRNGLRPPRDLSDLQRALSLTAIDGQEMPEVDEIELSGDSELMSAAQVSKMLGLPLRTLARRTADGTIPSVKIGRLRKYRRSELEKI